MFSARLLLLRRQFLVNAPFQIRFSLVASAWVFLSSVVFPFIIYKIFAYFTWYLAVTPRDAGLVELLSMRNRLVLLLIAIQVALISFTFLFGILISHRIAGPIFKLNLYMKSTEEGRSIPPLYFRKTDYFHELADSFNSMRHAIEERGEGGRGADAAIIHIEKALERATGPVKQELEKVLSLARQKSAD